MIQFTYAQFHALFLLPPLVALSTVTLWTRRQRSIVRAVPLAAITAVALVYTTPWDNYLIARGVWRYADGSVSAVVWRAPVEEYAFVLIQPLLGALWLHLLSQRFDPPTREIGLAWRDRALGALAGLPIGVAGVLLLRAESTFYLGAILAWAAPVLALQWAVGWRYLLARWRLCLVAIAVPTLYLSTADRIAIESGLWQLASQYTTGLTVGGLPIEEGVFFLLTATFVVQGLVLYPWVIERWR